MSPRRRPHHDNGCHNDGRRQLHCDSGCYDDGRKIHRGGGCCDDGQHRVYPGNGSYDDGRPVPQGVAGGRLFRSRSEETLSNMSLLPRRRLSTLRRRKKIVAATADRLISDFNDGKEVDLDKLTAQVAVAADRSGSGGRVGKPEESARVSTQANVLNWLRAQNDGPKWTGSATQYHSVDVHHL